MPYCKNCKRKISKFDNELCPYCGTENPIEGDYKTMDITSNISKLNPSYKLYKSKSLKIYALLCALLGILGIHEFYIGFIKKGFILFGISVVVEAIAGLLMYFLIFNSWLGFIIPLACLYFIYIIIAIVLLTKDSIKDSEGEFLR